MKTILDKIIVPAPASQGATTTKSGLFVPSISDQAQYIKSEVVAVGEKAADLVSVGQTIHFNRLAAPKVAINGDDYYVLRMDDVLAIE
jgi:co-chaperonin GroES (HSP10)